MFAALDHLNQAHSWSHDDHFLGRVERCVAAIEAHEVLDVGCGTGNLVDRLRRHARVVGLEPDPDTGARLRRRLFWRHTLIYDAG